MLRNHFILGVHINGRVQHIPQVQKILTDYGCSIRTRLGLHEASDSECSPNGLIVLELIGDIRKSRELAEKLRALDGVEVKEMLFDHP